MGMFDSFYFRSGAERVCCAAGHPQIGELQTKDLDCVLASYQIAGEPLRAYAKPYRIDETDEIVDGTLTIVRRTTYAPEALNGEVTMYTSCSVCDPIVYEREGFGMHTDIDTTSPWCEWVVTFRDGLVVDVKPVRLDTREDTAKQTRENSRVLPDDDRVAKRAIEQFHARRHA